MAKDTKPAQEAAGPDYTLEVCDVARTMARPGCDTSNTVQLSADYYTGDRSMRESGFGREGGRHGLEAYLDV